MIAQSLDRIVSVYYPNAHIRLVLANVTDTAKTLERNHLCGPVAGLIQAELVGGAALLGTLLSEAGQTISLRLKLPEGLLGGATIECAHGYTIRGYTHQKILADLDGSDEPDEKLFDKALGRSATCAVVRSDNRGASSNAQFGLNLKETLTIADVIEEYFCTSLQQRALVQLSAASQQGYVVCSHALMCDFLPEATTEDYTRIESLFAQGLVQDALDAGTDIAGFAKLFGLNETPNEEMSHSVSFACTCSSERVLAMLRTLSPEEREAMAAEGKPKDIYCHMCGNCYSITPEQLRSL